MIPTRRNLFGLALLLSAVVFQCFAPSRLQAQETTSSTNHSAIYQDGWVDFNKNGRKDVFEDPTQPVDRRVEDLLSQMTVEEKTCQLATLYGFTRVLKDPLPTAGWKNQIWKDGVANIDEMHNGIGGGPHTMTVAEDPVLASPAETVKALNEVQRWFVEETRLGIPAEYTDEGIRGLNYRNSVNFPANIALGASWDRNLISTVGGVVAKEAKAVGYRNVYAPILDLARDPRWGRVVETYGEDPYLVGEYGLRMTRALQTNGIVSTAKHFAVYSEPKGGRDGLARTDPHVAPREMELLHLRPWERAVREGGLLGAMSSYNDYDGVPISGDADFLIKRLRQQWGFRGYVVSDSDAVEFLYTKHHVAASANDAAAMFLREGGNVRTTFTLPDQFILPIRREIAAGKLTMSVVDDRVRDVLRVKFIEGLFDQPYVDPAKANAAIGSAENKAVALRAARESLVLLKNENQTLPLNKNLKRILVCGPTAKMKETSYDRYGSNGGQVVSVLEGIEALLKNSGVRVDFAQGCETTDKRWPESELFPELPSGDELKQIQDAVEQSKSVEAIILCLGDSNATIGESKSRTSLDLPGFQTDLAKALLKTGKPLVVVLLNGKPASVNWINRYCPAILEAWVPGEAGGTAVAEALFGDYNPGGKLPVTFPKTVGQIPFNFPFKPGSQASQNKKADANGFGDSMAEGALYPFGFGLSYTKFTYANLKISPAKIPTNGEVAVTFDLKNVGDRAGDEVVQLYFHQVTSSVTTYVLNLSDFARVSLQPGETKTVTMTIHPRELEIINREGHRVVEPGTFNVMVGASSEDIRLTGHFEVADNASNPRQSAVDKEKMMYADTTRRSKPWSKNPFVLNFGGRYLMYSSILPVKGSEAREIEITESHDLIHWKNVGYIRVQEPYEKNGISAPCAVVKDGKVHLFYQTYGNGTNDAICHAVSDDGVTNFKRDASNPIFHPDGAWNCGRAIDAEVFFHDGKYLMYYATRDPGYKTQMLGVATAPANTSFAREEWTHLSKAGPILKPELAWEGECIEAPSIIRRNGILYMFYAGSYDNTPQQIGVATSKDGVKWTRLFAEPFLRNGKPGEWNSSESGHPDIFDDGDRTFLFFQGNPDKGKTWRLSNVEVFWYENGPFLKIPSTPHALNLDRFVEPQATNTFSQKSISEAVDWLEVRVNAADDNTLPRVLLIGDSISGGYFSGVATELKGRANVSRLGTSRGLGDPRLFDEIRLVMNEYKFDVIHFNNGLHGWAYTEDEFRAEFPKLLQLLKDLAPNAKLIWATTTPYRTGAPKFEQFDPRNDRVLARNAIAAQFINKAGIPTDDLYALEENHPERVKDGVHYKPDAAEVQAKQVAKYIIEALPKSAIQPNGKAL